jgi:hypothetical protein
VQSNAAFAVFLLISRSLASLAMSSAFFMFHSLG